MANVTFTKISTGNFEAQVDGVVKYEIMNQCQGLSGNGKNEYGIKNVLTGKYHHSVGSLAKCKKQVANWNK